MSVDVTLGDAQVREECSTVTCGDYHDVIIISSSEDSAAPCVLGVESGASEAWHEWIRNAAAVCTFLFLCQREGLSADLAESACRPLKEAAQGGVFELELDGPDFFETPTTTRAVAMLLTENTAVLRCTDCVLEERRAARLFEAVQRCRALRSAQFIGCGIGPLSVRQLCRALIGVAQNVEELDLTDNILGDDGAAALAETVACLPRLRDLRLAKNQITYVGARALAARIGRASNLRSLDLSENPIGDFGMEAVARSLEGLPYLETLVLHSCTANAEGTLQMLVQGLIENRNSSAVGGLAVLDLQDNMFAPAAIKRFLTQCSSLGAPQMIKLGRRQRERMVMAMDGEDEDMRRGQVVDLGYIPAKVDNRDQHWPSSSSPNQGSPKNADALAAAAMSRLEIVFGQEIAPFRVLSAVSNLLGIYAGQARIEPHETIDSRAQFQVATLEFMCDTPEQSQQCAENLITHFRDGNSLLALLHIVDVRRPRYEGQRSPATGPRVATSVSPRSSERDDDSRSPVSVVLRPSSEEGSFISSPKDRTLIHLARKAPRAEQEQSLLDAVRALLVIEDLGRNSDSIKAQLRTIAAMFARLDLFVPSEKSEIQRFLLEAKLARADPEEAVRPLSPLDSCIGPTLAWALARLAQCTPSDALVLRAYVAALFGDVERSIAAAEQGKFALGLMPSLSQLTSFESAALQAAANAQDTETFSLILSQDLSEEEVSAGTIRLAGIVHHDLSAKSAVLRPRNTEIRELKLYEEDPASFAGLVVEFLRFERLNSRWSPRELRLQYSSDVRSLPITRPLPQIRRDLATISSWDRDEVSEDTYDTPSRFFKSASEAKVERAYVSAARRMSALLLQASGDSRRVADDPQGYGAAHEAFGIAYANREIGMVDELLAQLICQTMCNPTLRSQETYWKLMVVALRILEPSTELCDVLLEVLEHRMNREVDPHHMIRWATDALEERLTIVATDRKVRRLFASDASLRLDLLRQTLNETEAMDIDIHCWNGTGAKVRVAPFTSFEDLLAEVSSLADRRLRRHPGKSFPKSTLQDNTARWKDFCFTYSDAQEEVEVLAWQSDAYWWRWKLAVAEVLQQGENLSNGNLNNNASQDGSKYGDSKHVDSDHSGAIRIRLESYICAPTLWFYSSSDVLRAELLYWQRMAFLLRGEMCTSNPEALGYVASLAACVQISGGIEQWLDLDASDRARVSLGHVPKAVRRRVGKRSSNPWMTRFQHAVDRFSSHVTQSMAQAIVAGSEAPTQADLQRAMLAYTETWPLANGLVFRDVKPILLHRAGKQVSLEDFGETKHLRARFVLNAKGLFLLALTRDAQTTRAIALLWWTPIDELMRVQLVDTNTLHLSTRNMDQFECQMESPRQLYKAIVSQCTTNMCSGNPHIATALQMVEFANHFRVLPWPPPPPPLYDPRGDPVELDQGLEKPMDLSTTATVLAERVLAPSSGLAH